MNLSEKSAGDLDAIRRERDVYASSIQFLEPFIQSVVSLLGLDKTSTEYREMMLHMNCTKAIHGVHCVILDYYDKKITLEEAESYFTEEENAG